MGLRMAVKVASSRQGAGEGTSAPDVMNATNVTIVPKVKFEVGKTEVVWHPARGCVRFKCACGRVLGWKHKSGGKRIPDEDRSEMCPCGVMHTR